MKAGSVCNPRAYVCMKVKIHGFLLSQAQNQNLSALLPATGHSSQLLTP